MSSYIYIRKRIPWWLKWTSVWLICLALSIGKSWSQCNTITYPLCSGASYTLTTPVGVNQIKWYKDGVLIAGSTSSTLNVSTAGNYTWAATNTTTTCRDSLCCPVKVVACNEYQLCLGETYTLTTPTGLTNIQWYKDGVAVTAPTGQAASLVVSTLGNYTWAATNTNTSCRDSLCTPVKIIVCESYPICAGESYTLTAPAGLTNIQWYRDGVAVLAPSGTAMTFITTAVGNYTWAGTNSTTTCRDSLCNAVKLVAGNCPKGSLGDYVWKDTNNDGIQNETGTGVKDVILELYKNGVATGIKYTTDIDGKYLFAISDSASYQVKIISALPVGCTISTKQNAATGTEATDSDFNPTTGLSDAVTVNPLNPAKKDVLTVDAALYSPKGSLGDYVWKDSNNDGIQNETGTGVKDVILELYKNGVATGIKDTTDIDGKYLFAISDSASYQVKIISALPAGCTISTMQNAATGTEATDSDFNATGLSDAVTVNPLNPAKKDVLTVDAALYSPKGSLGDYVWKDSNNDGIQNETGTGVKDVILELYKNGVATGIKDTTDIDGKYLFAISDSASYQVKIISALPAGCTISTMQNAATGTEATDSDFNATGLSDAVTVNPLNPAKKDVLTVDAALYSPKGSLGDYVWKDTNNDGIQNETGTGVKDVILELYKNGVATGIKDTTDIDGKYLFAISDSASYQVKIISALPAGCTISTKQNTPSDDTKDSDFNPTTGLSDAVTVNPLNPLKKDVLTVDAALYSPKGSLGDYVWKDSNNDGIQNETGTGVKDVILELYKNGVATGIKDTTDIDGKYLFAISDSASYQVKIISALPAGCTISTKQNAATGTEATDSDFNPTTGLSDAVMVNPLNPLKKDVLTVDAALYSPKGSLGDYVWKDTNNDGIQNETGTGVKDVILELYKNGVATGIKDTTDIDGKYLFAISDSASYQVKIVSALPAGCTISTKQNAATGTEATDSDFNPTTGLSDAVTVNPLNPAKKDVLTVDAALYSPKGSLGDYVWKDTNNDGIQNETGTGIKDVILELYKNNVATGIKDTTDIDGKYLFTISDSASYQVKIVSALPAGCTISTKQNAATGTEATDSDFNPTTGLSDAVTVNPLNPANKDVLTVDAALYSPKGSLGDYVWKDTNNDGIQNETGTGVKDVILELYKNGVATGIKDTTDIDGKYLFTISDSASYQVKIISTLPAGCTISTKQNAATGTEATDSDFNPTTGLSDAVTVNPLNPAKKDVLTVDAALFSPKGSLGDYVWKDTNNDGIQNETGTGVKDVILELYKNGVATGIKDTTDIDGKYLFTISDSASYQVKIISALPAGCTISTMQNAATGTEATDSDFNPTTGLSDAVTVNPLNPLKKDVLTVDAALYSPKGSLGDYVWKDTNNDGIQNETGTGVKDVIVQLLQGTTVVATDTTDTAGLYLFPNLSSGTYQVKILTASLPAGCTLSTQQNKGTDDAKDSDFDPTTGLSQTVTIDALGTGIAKDNLTVDGALYSPKGSIGDYVWKDANNDGIQDATELPVKGVIVQLLSSTGAVLATDTTDAAGLYLFPNLSSGTYQVKLLTASLPAGCTLSTQQNKGTDDAKDSDFDPTTGLSQTVTIDATGTGIAKDNLTVDGALYSPKGSIGDYVWKDANNDGIQDATELPVKGVIVQLLQGTNVVATDTTDAAGLYLFPNLSSGTYQVKLLTASLPAGCILSTMQNKGTDDTKDSDFDPATGLSQTVTIDALGTGIAKDNNTVDGALYVPCILPSFKVTTPAACTNNNSTWSVAITVTQAGFVKVNKGTISGIGTGPYTITGIPAGTSLVITDSLSATCKKDTIITPPISCGCITAPPVIAIGQNLMVCKGDTFPTLKATVVGYGTVDWYKQSAGGVAVATGTLSYKPTGTVTVSDTFYLAARNLTVGTCPDPTQRTMLVVTAQNCIDTVDLHLTKKVDKKTVQLGDVITYTIKVWNESTKNATGVEVTDQLPAGVQYVSSVASRGNYNNTTGVWTIGNIAALTTSTPIVGDTVTLSIKAKVIAEGVTFNTAEISRTNEKDKDSSLGNGVEGEDDLDRVCITTPIKLCVGQGVDVTIPSTYAGIVWKDAQGNIVPSSVNIVTFTKAGIYSFTATNGACPTGGCCPVIVEEINCCPAEICIPFSVIKRRK